MTTKRDWDEEFSLRFRNKIVFSVVIGVILCLPSVVFAVPLENSVVQKITSSEVITAENSPTNAPYLAKDSHSISKELLISVGQSSGIKLDTKTNYDIYLDNTLLGSYPPDTNGQVFVQVVVPADANPGIHVIRVTNGVISLQKHLDLTP